LKVKIKIKDLTLRTSFSLHGSEAQGANYREANRAESHDDFIHKIGIVEKEASESEYWLELVEEAHLADAQRIGQLLRESRYSMMFNLSQARSGPRRNFSIRSTRFMSRTVN
jgi:hypothetical protein